MGPTLSPYMGSMSFWPTNKIDRSSCKSCWLDLKQARVVMIIMIISGLRAYPD